MTLPLQVHTRSGLTAPDAKPIQLHSHTYHNNLQRQVESNYFLQMLHKQALQLGSENLLQNTLESE